MKKSLITVLGLAGLGSASRPKWSSAPLHEGPAWRWR